MPVMRSPPLITTLAGVMPVGAGVLTKLTRNWRWRSAGVGASRSTTSIQSMPFSVALASTSRRRFWSQHEYAVMAPSPR